MATKSKAAKKKVAKKKAARKPDAADQFVVEPHWLNKKQMAKALGISVQAFDKWGLKPVAQRHQYGEAFFSVADVVAFKCEKAAEAERKKYERFIIDDEGMSADDLILATERANLRWTEERAEGQALKNAQLRRELAPVGMLTWALGNLASQISAVMNTLPGKIKRRLPKLSAAELEIIKRETAKVMNTASEIKLDWEQYEPDEPG